MTPIEDVIYSWVARNFSDRRKNTESFPCFMTRTYIDEEGNEYQETVYMEKDERTCQRRR